MMQAESEVSHFDICFDRASARFYEGENLCGNVTLQLDYDMVVDTLKLDFSGSASVDWLKKPKNISGPHRDVEKHLNQLLTLYSRGAEDDELALTAGRHDYPFQIQLPFDLPSSFNGTHGRIKYRAKATIGRPWLPKISVQSEFTVISVLDLNTSPRLALPVQCHKVSEPLLNRCCLRSSKDSCMMLWRLDRTGFVPGERIRINGEVHNNGRTRIRNTTVQLVQHVEFVDVWGHSLHEEIPVRILQKPGPIRGGEIEFWRDELIVPSTLPPTGLKSCNSMNLCYSIKFRVVPGGLSKALETSVDIVIGTVSLTTNATGSISTIAMPYLGGSLGNSETKLDCMDDYDYFV